MEEKLLLGYCYYCHNPIFEGEGHKYIGGKGLVHYDLNNVLNNCYYPELEEEV